MTNHPPKKCLKEVFLADDVQDDGEQPREDLHGLSCEHQAVTNAKQITNH